MLSEAETHNQLQRLHRNFSYTVSAFYHNDWRNGAGLIVGIAKEPFTEFIQVYEDAWLSEPDQATCARQLEQQIQKLIDKGRDGWTEEESFTFIGDVWLLSKHGYLPDDNFNGIYVHEKRQAHTWNPKIRFSLPAPPGTGKTRM